MLYRIHVLKKLNRLDDIIEKVQSVENVCQNINTSIESNNEKQGNVSEQVESIENMYKELRNDIRNMPEQVADNIKKSHETH